MCKKSVRFRIGDFKCPFIPRKFCTFSRRNRTLHYLLRVTVCVYNTQLPPSKSSISRRCMCYIRSYGHFAICQKSIVLYVLKYCVRFGFLGNSIPRYTVYNIIHTIILLRRVTPNPIYPVWKKKNSFGKKNRLIFDIELFFKNCIRQFFPHDMFV